MACRVHARLNAARAPSRVPQTPETQYSHVFAWGGVHEQPGYMLCIYAMLSTPRENKHPFTASLFSLVEMGVRATREPDVIRFRAQGQTNIGSLDVCIVAVIPRRRQEHF